MPSAQAMAGLHRTLQAQLGAEAEVLEERVLDASAAPGLTVYVRTARFATAPASIDVTVATDSGGMVHGFSVRATPPRGPAPSPDYQTRTPLRLPFQGEWYVFWGGRTPEQNYHAAHPDQRYAYDLVVRRDGRSHSGDGSALEDYYCWGQPILAPGAGTVVTAVEGLPDQRPGSMDPANRAGNHVILDHGNGEYSLLAHVRSGSVGVRPGQRVEAGQKVGECGNSGNTSEPHLHYHLQNGPVFGDAHGLPAQFTEYVADGHAVERGEPVKGQTVRHGRP